MSTVSLGRITLGYDDNGSGEPVLLIHGHPLDRSMWRPQIEQLNQAGWRVIAPDLRGYGQSTVVPGITRLETFARDITALLDHLAFEHCVLGGLSMGGQIVMELYRLFPQRIRGLLLADTSAAAETDHGKTRRHDLADRLLRQGMTPYASELLPTMLTPHTLRAMPAVAQHVLRMMRDTPPAGAAAALRGRAERPDYVAMLPRIAVPTLVIVGSHDELTPISDAQLLRDRIPNTTLQIIHGAAHLPNLERPRQFNAALRQFLDSLPTAARSPGSAQEG